MPQVADAVVIGGGIAGVSVACELATDRSVLLLEAEATLAQHTTGRSAATLLRTLGNKVVRTLTRFGADVFSTPPDGFDGPLVSSRPAIWIAGKGRADKLRQFGSNVTTDTVGLRELDESETRALAPYLRPDWASLGLLDELAMDMDVSMLHQGYLRVLQRRGGSIQANAQVVKLGREHGTWNIHLADSGSICAPLLVNAAGAWADSLAKIAGARPLGLRPLRRTLFSVSAPAEMRMTDELASVSDVDESFYVKPKGPEFWCSPADETPSEPCDARPEEVDVAKAIDTINEATLLEVRSIRSQWAGLRTFAVDRSPVLGMDGGVPGFLWAAGQGGFGIQAAPGIATAAASIVRTGDLPESFRQSGLTVEDLSPTREALRPRVVGREVNRPCP
jgi:D-arginine dehydrogenase